MSQRETLKKPFNVSAINGVNERATLTELPLSDFSLVEGTFPQYAGQQTRIPGKRLLSLYPNPIYGIFQFWTPVGYAAGLYQFEGSLDTAPWLTPTSNIVIPAIPASIGFDGGGMTLGDFGQSYGEPFSPPNVCIVGFVGMNSAHVMCGTPPGPLPDDSNGSGAGDGRTCRWEERIDTYTFTEGSFIGQRFTRSGEYSQTVYTGPTPQIIDIGPYAELSTTPVVSALSMRAAITRYSSCNFNGGIGAWVGGQNGNTASVYGTIDLSPYNGQGILRFEMVVQSGLAFPRPTRYVPMDVTMDENGNYMPYAVDPLIFKEDFAPTFRADNRGYDYEEVIILEAIRTVRNERICS